MANKNSVRLYFKILLVAFSINLVWENLHASLYDDYFLELKRLFFSVCAVIDGLITLLIYFLARLVFKDPLWIMHSLSFRRAVVVLGIATIMEKAAVFLGLWSYEESMPIVPLVEIGFSPFLQITFLPLLTFLLIFFFQNKAEKKFNLFCLPPLLQAYHCKRSFC
jgi:hypothetical protein